MRKVTVLFALLALATAPLLASMSPQEEAAQETAQVTGELVRLDAAAQSLTVKQEDGTEVELFYNEKTQIEGADSIEGLNTMSGSKVTVDVRQEGSQWLATSIQVHS